VKYADEPIFRSPHGGPGKVLQPGQLASREGRLRFAHAKRYNSYTHSRRVQAENELSTLVRDAAYAGEETVPEHG